MNNLIERLKEIGCIKYGDFVLKNGDKTTYYFDLRQVIGHPKILKETAMVIWQLLKPLNFDLICGVAYSAFPIATCISIEKEVPMVMRRKEKKAYGTGMQIEGKFSPGQKCVVIEDVITTGDSVLETVVDLEKAGLEIRDIVALINRDNRGVENLRSRNYNVYTAFDLDAILKKYPLI